MKSESTLVSNENVGGFTLIEIAIVLVIVGLLLGGLLMPLAAQVEQQRTSETQKLLEEIKDAIIGFAILNGRLPCPASPTSSGNEGPVGGGACTVQHGFVPAVSLGLGVNLNLDRLLVDSWGNPIRYSVTTSDFDADGNWDFTTPNEMRNVQMVNLGPNLQVCSAQSALPAACTSVATNVATTAVVVLFSMGKDWASFTSADQVENVGGTLGGGPSGLTYQVPNDVVFVSRQYGGATGNEYDDIVTWISPPQLYNRLVAAGQLP